MLEIYSFRVSVTFAQKFLAEKVIHFGEAKKHAFYRTFKRFLSKMIALNRSFLKNFLLQILDGWNSLYGQSTIKLSSSERE
jgi:hypothetical protein